MRAARIDAEITVLERRVAEARERQQQANQRIRTLRDEMSVRRREFSEVEAELRELNAAEEPDRGRVAELTKRRQQLREAIESSVEEGNVLRTRIREVEKAISEANSQLESLSTERDFFRSEVTQLEAEEAAILARMRGEEP